MTTPGRCAVYTTEKMIPCPYTNDVQHRWVLGSDLDGKETLQVVCKECGHIAYSVSTPGLLLDSDLDVDVEARSGLYWISRAMV